MPRSLCAAKRQIKETVISSAASAADRRCSGRAGWWSWEGLHFSKVSKGRIGEGGMGEEKGEDGVANRRSAP